MPTFEDICMPLKTVVRKSLERLSKSPLQSLNSMEEANILMQEVAYFTEGLNEKSNQGICITRITGKLLIWIKISLSKISDPERLLFNLEVLSRMCEIVPDLMLPFIHIELPHSIETIRKTAMHTIKKKKALSPEEKYQHNSILVGKEEYAEETKNLFNHLQKKISKCDYCDEAKDSNLTSKDQASNQKRKRRLSDSENGSSSSDGRSSQGSANGVDDQNAYLEEIKNSSGLSATYKVSGRPTSIKKFGTTSNGRTTILLSEALPPQPKKRGIQSRLKY